MFKVNKLTLSVAAVLFSGMSINAYAQQNLVKQEVQMNPLAPGIIVKYKNNSRSKSLNHSKDRAIEMGKAFGVELSYKRTMSGGAEVLSLDMTQSKQLSRFEVQDMLNELNKRADVEYAEIDAWMVPFATPNDTSYNTQWHYFENAGGMRLPAAWDTTTGSSSVTVAVLDTGYRPHADLAGNVVGEYDMISSTAVSVDGNGRDGNAQDPGDFSAANECRPNTPARNSSWHGTHVAGTVGAVSNNNNAVAGVAWDVNLVPVRVLGKCGGSLSDIADGIRWAAGLNVAGVPNNPNPAEVINMSLGSSQPGACSNTYQSAINAAVNAGTTVVAAAGNSNSSSGFSPANCNNVISVAATNRDGGRAYYSNYGTTIDVAAPGGDACMPPGEGAPQSLADCRGGVWTPANMVQSTHNSGTSTPGNDIVAGLQGTSMASPHVAGLAALLYSVKPNATPAEIENTLESTARAFPNVSSHQCATSGTTDCGAGIVDANAAVQAIGGNNNPPPVGGNFFENTSNVNIPDNNPAGATSNLNVTRTGASGTIEVTYSIVHTYIGDLKVEIFTPTGETAVLRDGTGGSANNINESRTLNAGTIESSGNWRLKVTDSAGADVGFIDSWSIEFQ